MTAPNQKIETMTNAGLYGLQHRAYAGLNTLREERQFMDTAQYDDIKQMLLGIVNATQAELNNRSAFRSAEQECVDEIIAAEERQNERPIYYIGYDGIEYSIAP